MSYMWPVLTQKRKQKTNSMRIVILYHSSFEGTQEIPSWVRRQWTFQVNNFLRDLQLTGLEPRIHLHILSFSPYSGSLLLWNLPFGSRYSWQSKAISCYLKKISERLLRYKHLIFSKTLIGCDRSPVSWFRERRYFSI